MNSTFGMKRLELHVEILAPGPIELLAPGSGPVGPRSNLSMVSKDKGPLEGLERGGKETPLLSEEKRRAHVGIRVSSSWEARDGGPCNI